MPNPTFQRGLFEFFDKAQDRLRKVPSHMIWHGGEVSPYGTRTDGNGFWSFCRNKRACPESVEGTSSAEAKSCKLWIFLLWTSGRYPGKMQPNIQYGYMGKFRLNPNGEYSRSVVWGIWGVPRAFANSHTGQQFLYRVFLLFGQGLY